MNRGMARRGKDERPAKAVWMTIVGERPSLRRTYIREAPPSTRAMGTPTARSAAKEVRNRVSISL